MRLDAVEEGMSICGSSDDMIASGLYFWEHAERRRIHSSKIVDRLRPTKTVGKPANTRDEFLDRTTRAGYGQLHIIGVVGRELRGATVRNRLSAIVGVGCRSKRGALQSSEIAHFSLRC